MKNYLIPLAVAALLAACGGGSPDSTARAPQAMRVAQGGAVPAAVNTYVFTGIRSNYTISATEAGYTIADQTGVDATQLVPLGASAAQFADLTVSFDTAGDAGKLYRLVLAATGRVPGGQELGLMLKRRADGVTLETIAAELMSGAEYLALYGSNQDDAAFVTSLYVNVLQRQPDADGMNAWLAALANGMTRTAALMASAESAENIARVAPQLAGGIEYLAVPKPGSATQNFWAKSVSVSNGYACALTTVGGVKCWGIGSGGQLGDGLRKNSTVPVDVSGLTSGVKQMKTGYMFACALTTGNQVKCWGFDSQGQLGDGVTPTSLLVSPVPTTVVAPAGAAQPATPVQIEVGNTHACMLTAAGEVYCWGANGGYQLTAKTISYSAVPLPIVDAQGNKLSGIKKISSGFNHICALTNAGGVKCWGDNSYGELGTGQGGTRVQTAVDVLGLSSGYVDVRAGYMGSCALASDSTVKCWGRYIKDLGAKPVDVLGFTGGKAFAVDGMMSNTVCTTAPGAVNQCWAGNNNGQLGTWNRLTTYDVVTPTVAGQKLTVYATSASMACAASNSGRLMCWGAGSSGQMGDGKTSPDLPDPIIVHYVNGFN